jgi:hypothetical protein
VHGLSSAKAKAKSFVSCAIGKMDQWLLRLTAKI